MTFKRLFLSLISIAVVLFVLLIVLVEFGVHIDRQSDHTAYLYERTNERIVGSFVNRAVCETYKKAAQESYATYDLECRDLTSRQP